MEQMKKDWVGNSKAIYSCHGASNHSEEEREEHDFYATPPIATELLLELERFCPLIYEPACGLGHISEVLKAHGHKVYSTDLVARGYEDEVCDFFDMEGPIAVDIITNPPYSLAKEFTEHAMDILAEGHKLAMFLKLTFLEGQNRRELFKKYPPKTIYVSVSRLGCAKNGEFKKDKNGGLKADSAVAYAWFIFEKGFHGEPTLKWFN